MVFSSSLCGGGVGQRFVILGDRTGSVQPGVYEQVWREAAADKPDFVLTVGDTIEGLADAKAAGEWQEWQGILQPYARIPLYLTPGNHDIWSAPSAQLFEKNAAARGTTASTAAARISPCSTTAGRRGSRTRKSLSSSRT